MPEEIKRLSGTVTLQVVAEQSDAAAAVANAVRNLDIKEGDDWGVIQSDSNIVITYPKDSGNAGGTSGTQWWNVAVDGQPMYCQFGSGTPVASLPDGASVVNPD